MTKITLDTVWYPEHRDLVVSWIASLLSHIREADLKGQPTPSVRDIQAKLGISDEKVAAYILVGTECLFKKWREWEEARSASPEESDKA